MLRAGNTPKKMFDIQLLNLEIYVHECHMAQWQNEYIAL
jgi:hypothetical protein